MGLRRVSDRLRRAGPQAPAWIVALGACGVAVLCDVLYALLTPAELDAVSSVIRGAVLALIAGLVAWAWLRNAAGRERAERELRSAYAELERSNSQLAEFAHLVTHELAEPLATAALFAESIEAYRDRGLDTTRLIAQVRETLELTQERIHAVLEVAQVRGVRARDEPFDSGALVERVLGELRALVAATGAEISIGPLPEVRGDREQLALVFENLLSNAMRHGRNGACPIVSVAADREGAGWRFTVSDQGPGVASEDRARIFELFGRARDEQRPGTGIGLALCKAVVEAHGGRIWVESAAGGGSSFHFTLR